MSKKLWLNHLTLILTGVLFVQFTVGNMVFSNQAQAQATTPQLSGLSGQLSPNDPCAWWNTTSSSNCSSSNAGSNSLNPTNNPDPWNWGGDDPTWNPSSSDNNVWGSDPNNAFSSPWTGSVPQPILPTYMQPFKGTLNANYFDRITKTIGADGVLDQNTIEVAAAHIIQNAAVATGAYGAIGTTALYAMNAASAKLWKGNTIGYGATMGVGTTFTVVSEAFVVADRQLAMVMELMELYGLLPTNVIERADSLAVIAGIGMAEALSTKGLTALLKLQDLDAPDTPSVPPAPVDPLPPTPPTVTTELTTEVQKLTGVSEQEAANALRGKEATGVEQKLVDAITKDPRTSIWSRIERLPQKSFMKWPTAVVNRLKFEFDALPVQGKLIFSWGMLSLISGVTAYSVTKILGHHELKKFKMLAAERKHRVLLALQNDSDAKHAMWLILTKFVFKPEDSAAALTPEETKLYAAIVSQEFPLLHFRGHSEEESLFNSYKQSAIYPAPVTTKPPVAQAKNSKPQNTKDPMDVFGDTPLTSNQAPTINSDDNWTNFFGKPNTTSKASDGSTLKSTQIDKILTRLGRYLDEDQKLYFVKIIESGMLMKGFLSDSDRDAIEAIAVELGLTYPKSVTKLNVDDPRKLTVARYISLLNGLVGEVRKKVLIYGTRSAQEKAKTGQFLDKADYGYVSGEMMLQDFYDPKEKVLSANEIKQVLSGEHDSDYKNDEVNPIISGDKKVPPPTKLDPKHTTDGSPYPWDEDAISMIEAQQKAKH